MKKIVLRNKYYQYVMALDDEGHLFHCCFLPDGEDDRRTAEEWRDRCRNPFPFEAIVNVDREPLQVSHGVRYFYPKCTARAVFRGMREEPLEKGGTRTVITLEDAAKGLLLHLNYEVYPDSPAIRRFTAVENAGGAPVELDHVSSFVLSNFPYGEDDCRSIFLHSYTSQWSFEGQERVESFADLGLFDEFCRNGYAVESTGTWVCQKNIPYFVIEQRGAGLFTGVQIEYSSSWRFEAGAGDLVFPKWYYIQGGMGNHLHAHWCKTLEKGETFVSPAASLTVAKGGIEEVYNLMHTHQQRILIHRSRGDADLPVIYNDWPYMQANVTEDKIIEQLDSLKDCGVDVYVTDSGWFTEPAGRGSRSSWWDMSGHWQPDPERFPHGLSYVVEQIEARGMRAGIWCEIEAVGTESENYNDPELLLKNEIGFVEDANRRFLNFASVKGRAFADSVFDRLAGYGFKYIKIDYNIDSAPGCIIPGETSLGQGLHRNRMAYYDWLDGVRRRYPQLIIENCSSGGMRLEYGMLSRTDMASITDQGSYRLIGAVFHNVSKLIAPCQCGAWSWLEDGFDLREYAFALTNSMGGRMHLSGNVVRHDKERQTLLREAVALYKEYRHILPSCRVYYHTDGADYAKNDRLRVMELASPDGNEAVVIAQRPLGGEKGIAVRPKGLDGGGKYVVRAFPSGETSEISGEALCGEGFPITFEGDFSAGVYYFRRSPEERSF